MLDRLISVWPLWYDVGIYGAYLQSIVILGKCSHGPAGHGGQCRRCYDDTRYSLCPGQCHSLEYCKPEPWTCLKTATSAILELAPRDFVDISVTQKEWNDPKSRFRFDLGINSGIYTHPLPLSLLCARNAYDRITPGCVDQFFALDRLTGIAASCLAHCTGHLENILCANSSSVAASSS